MAPPKGNSRRTRKSSSESSLKDVEASKKSPPTTKSKHSSDESEEEEVINVKGSPQVEKQPPPSIKNSPTIVRKRITASEKSNEKKHDKSVPDPTASKETSPYKRIAMLAVIVLFAAGILYIEFVREGDETFTGNRSLIEVRSEIISFAKILRETTNQDKDFWLDILVGLDNLAEVEPRQASILMFAVPKTAESTAVCLSQLLAGYVKKSFRDRGPKLIHDTRKFLSMSPADHKLALDNELMGLNSSHSAVIYNLELMPAETATLLHGYCDNDNAPFKRAMIFLLVEINTPYQDVPVNKLDSFMENFFFKMYGPQLDPDHIPGLVSRLTPQVVLVRPESQETLSRVCV